jgi:hypothetical protein
MVLLDIWKLIAQVLQVVLVVRVIDEFSNYNSTGECSATEVVSEELI